jgi:plastocyanin
MLFSISGCGDDESGPAGVPPPGSTLHKKIVQMKDTFFVPRDVTIVRGDTIVWFNAGAMSHTTTSGISGSPDGLWNSGNPPSSWIPPGGMFQRVFDDTTGTFPYFCIPHATLNMLGSVTVNP